MATAPHVLDLSWPLTRLGEGIEHLARRAGLQPCPGEPIVVPDGLADGGTQELTRWVLWVVDRLGVEAEGIDLTAGSVDDVLHRAGPAVLRFYEGPERRFFLLLHTRRGVPRLLCPDLRVRACSAEVLRGALCEAHEAPLAPEIDRLLAVADVAAHRRTRVRSALARERLGTTRIGGGWLLRLPPAASLWRQMREARLPGRVATMFGIFAVVYSLEILSWGVIGAAALDGRFDVGWLTAWFLLLLSLIPLRLLGGWVDATLALDVSRLLKARLLLGALRLDVEAVRHQGVGQLLGRVMESQAFEALALNFGLASIVALVELGFAAWVLTQGASGPLHLTLLLFWVVVCVCLSLTYFRRLGAWTRMRLDMTHALVERMVGHRTTLAQESPQRRDRAHDAATSDYVAASVGLDRSMTPFFVGVPSGWMILGLAGLAPAFVAGSSTPARLAISLGGILLAGRALSGIASGLASAAGAAVAWKQIAPLFAAAGRHAETVPFVPVDRIQPRAGEGGVRLIDADGLTFRYRPEGEPVLRGASLTIHHGERLLIEGASGGGKSTLAALLVGLRTPSSGLLLLNGLDRFTLGDAWHHFATEAPQFHENHILTGTLGFNLLMGRNWPATDEELTVAADLCVELGLGDLLQRMPAGLMQTVGETGWQLSHGERSRVYLARALLQDAQLTILDESFAALDPESLEACLGCAMRRARTLAVIAHP